MPIDPLGLEEVADDPLGLNPPPAEVPRFMGSFPRPVFSLDTNEALETGKQLERESPFGASPFRAQEDWRQLTQRSPQEDLTSYPLSVQESTERIREGYKSTQGLDPKQRTALIDDINLRYGAYIKQASESGRNDVANSLEQQRRKALEDVGVGTIDLFPEPNLAQLTPQEQELLFGKGRLADVAGAMQRAVASTASGFATPEGLAMAIPGAGSAIGKAFLAQMIAHAPGEIASAAGAYSAGDDKAGDEHLVNAGATLAMLGAPLLASKIGENPTKASIRELVKQLDKAQIDAINVDLAARLRNQLPPRPEGQPVLPELQRTAQLVDQALQEATQKIIEPGKTPAIDLLKAQDAQIQQPMPSKPISAEGGGEAIFGRVSYNRPAEQILPGRTQSHQPIEPAAELAPEPSVVSGKLQDVPNQTPLKSVEDLIRQKLQQRDLVAAVDALSKQPAEVQRKIIDETVGANKKKVGLSAAEQTIFNELWAKVYRDSLGKPKETPSPQAEPTNPPLAGEQSAPKVDAISRAEASESARSAWIKTKEDAERAWQSALKSSGVTKDSPEGAAIRERLLNEWKPKLDAAQESLNQKTREEIDSKTRAPFSERVKSLSNPELASRLSGIMQFAKMVKEAGQQVAPEAFSNLVEVYREARKRNLTPINKELEAHIKEAPNQIPDTISKLESLKTDASGQGQLFTLPHPDAFKQIGKQVWNDAIDLAIAGVKGGKSAAEAMDAAIAFVKKNARNFDEAKLRQNLDYLLKNEFPAPPPDKKNGLHATDLEQGNPAQLRVAAKTPTGEIIPGKPGQIHALLEFPEGSEMGFVTPEGKYLTRDQAATLTANTKPAPGTVTLKDVYQRFEPVEAKPESLKQKGLNMVEAMRTGLSSKFRPLGKLAEDIARAYGRKNPKDVAAIFEQLKGSHGKGEAEIYRFDRDVSSLVKGSEKDFNAYLFLRRAIDRLEADTRDIERAKAGEDVKTLNRRKVARYTLNELNPKLKLLEEQLGPEKLKTFQKAADLYQQYMDKALSLQVGSGRMTPEVYKAIKAGNQFYAPFKVMKWIEDSTRPEGSSSQIDTMAKYTKAIEGIEDKNFRLGDMLAAARQNILLSRILADKNMAMRNITELAAFDTKKQFLKKLKSGEDAPVGMDAVNVLENGKSTRYAVNRDVADAVKNYDATGRNVVTRFLDFTAKPFRAGATAFNVPFQAVNLLLADMPRSALISKYGLRNVQDAVRYPLGFAHALMSSIAGNVFKAKDVSSSNFADVAGTMLNPHYINAFPKLRDGLFLDFLDSGVAGSTIAEILNPKSLAPLKPTLTNLPYRAVKGTLNTMSDFAQAIEQTNKILGVKRAMRFEGVKSGRELAEQIPGAITELRRFSGSPDFGRQGSAVEALRLNVLYMFLNARIQGTVADLGRALGRDGVKPAARLWTGLATAVGVPTAYLYYLNHSAKYKDDYEKRSAQERQNYWLIPKDSFITTEDGEQIRDFWRIPKRESSKWMANLTESALDFAHKKDPQAAMAFGNQMLQEISPINISGDTIPEKLESVASGIHPFLKAPAQMATGRDFYRHRNLIPDTMKEASPEQQYTERTPEVFKQIATAMPDIAPEVMRSPIMVENMTRDLTAGLITQFLPRKPVEGRSAIENSPLMQRFQAIPYEDSTEFKSQMEALKRESADDYLKRHRAAQKLLEDNTGRNLEEIVQKLPQQNITEADVKLYKHLVDLWVAKENGATSQDHQLIALPPKQRAQYIAAKLQNAPEGDRSRLFWEFAKKRVLTADTFAQLPDALKPLAETK